MLKASIEKEQYLKHRKGQNRYYSLYRWSFHVRPHYLARTATRRRPVRAVERTMQCSSFQPHSVGGDTAEMREICSKRRHDARPITLFAT